MIPAVLRRGYRSYQRRMALMALLLLPFAVLLAFLQPRGDRRLAQWAIEAVLVGVALFLAGQAVWPMGRARVLRTLSMPRRIVGFDASTTFVNGVPSTLVYLRLEDGKELTLPVRHADRDEVLAWLSRSTASRASG